MTLRFNILSPGNTGAPDYDICGQAASVVGDVNLAVEIKIAGVTVFTTANLFAAIMPVQPAVITPTINLVSFSYSGLNGFNIVLDTPLVGMETTLEIEVSKSGYIGYHNILDIYGYDLGNDTVINHNVPIDVYLINETNNLVNGIQTKSFSKVAVYRKPFTEEVHYYNMVGTNGTIFYRNGITSEVLSGSQRGQVCSATEIDIEQVITVYDGSGSQLDICTDGITAYPITWLPTYNSIVSCELECGDCVSSQSANNYVTTEVDFSLVDAVYVDDVQEYPTFQYDNNVIHELYDYTGLLNSDQTTVLNISSYPTVLGNTIFNFTIPGLGDNIIKTRFQVDGIIDCYITNIVSACNWFKIEETETCGEYVVSNCSFNPATLTISAMQADQTFSIISTVVMAPLEVTSVALTEDNIYTFSMDDGSGAEIIIVYNYCALKSCFFDYLDKIVCTKPCGDCQTKSFYNFNALIINAHTYFMMLNNEYNFNFLYSALSPTKVTELYDVKQVLDRMAEYCVANCSTGCKSCGC